MSSDFLARIFQELHFTEGRHTFSGYRYPASAFLLSATTIPYSVAARSGEKTKEKAENADALLE